MSLEELGNLGEFVGSIAVLVSLVYLAIQIKKSTETERSSTYRAIVADFTRCGSPKCGCVNRPPAAGRCPSRMRRAPRHRSKSSTRAIRRAPPCRRMERRRPIDIDDRLTEVFRAVFDDESIELQASMTAADIEGWDSIAHISLEYGIEEEFGIKLSAWKSSRTWATSSARRPGAAARSRARMRTRTPLSRPAPSGGRERSTRMQPLGWTRA